MQLAITDQLTQTAADIATIKASLPMAPSTAQIARVLRVNEWYAERLLRLLEVAGVCSKVCDRWCEA